jgi:spore germination protein KA
LLRGSGAEDGLKNMLKKILKQLALKKLLKKKNKQEQPLGQDKELSRDFEKNVELFKKILGKNRDFVQYEFVFGTHEKIRAALFYFEGLVYREYINEFILKPLMFQSHHFSSGELRRGKSIAHLRERLISIGGTEVVSKVDDILNNCLCGDTILLVDGYAEALALNTKGWKTRGVEEPKTEALVRGAREGFTESIGINMALLRRRIRHFEFTIEEMQIGAKTRTKVCIAYLKGVVNTGVLEEVRKRLGRIKTDAILESGYLEQFIEDAPFSIFPTVANSERPDTVAAKILEGRVAIITDGTPMVLTVPALFASSFQSPEDYYSRPYYASLIRWIRYICFFITVSAPAVYVALTTYHQELIPTPLLITMAAASEGTPFPALVEVLLMGVIFEILREAGIRLPRPIGTTISIVGALVIGESAVSAGLIGAHMVIVVSLTAISSFVIPAQTDAATILRFILIFAAGFMGAFGIFIVFLGLLVHLSSLRSFGVPYFAPFAPVNLPALQDTMVRVPFWMQLTRPKMLSRNRQRTEPGLMPGPEQKPSQQKQSN